MAHINSGRAKYLANWEDNATHVEMKYVVSMGGKSFIHCLSEGQSVTQTHCLGRFPLFRVRRTFISYYIILYHHTILYLDILHYFLLNDLNHVAPMEHYVDNMQAPISACLAVRGLLSYFLYSSLFIIIHHYSSLFIIIHHYSSLFIIIHLLSLYIVYI